MSLISLPTLDWRQADDGVFVATLAGEYAGFVDLTPGGAHAYSNQAVHLGSHHGLDDARAAVAASVVGPSSRPAPLPRPLRIRRRGTMVAPATRRIEGKTRWPLAP